MQKTSQRALVRGIRQWDLVAITINGIIGAGILGLPAKVYSLIGTYSLIAFVVCAFIVTLIILCFAEVSSRFEDTGGPYLYSRIAFGPTVAFEIGWLVWLARLTAFGANCNLMVNYLGYFFPNAASPFWRATIIILVVVTLTLVNLIGVKEATFVNNAFTIGKLIPLLMFIGAGLFFISRGAYTFGPAPKMGAFSQSVLLLIYAFTGFEMAVIPAGEAQNPQKHLPRALLIALAVVAFVYILIQVVCVGTLPELSQSTRPLADSASHFLGTTGGVIISAGAIVSVTGNLNILVLAASRVPFAMAEQRQLPSLICRVHTRFSTPYIAILLTATMMLFLTLKSSFVAALTISAIARLATYAATAIALPVLRKNSTAPKARFYLRGGIIIALLTLVLIVWLLSNSTLQEAKIAAIAAAVGLLIHFSYRLIRALHRRHARRPKSA